VLPPNFGDGTATILTPFSYPRIRTSNIVNGDFTFS